MKKDSTEGIGLGPFSAVARPPQRFWAKRVRVQRASKLDGIRRAGAKAGPYAVGAEQPSSRAVRKSPRAQEAAAHAPRAALIDIPRATA